ncbi:tigger transposable element-derived protein 4-like [Anopheles maculipalpis]|uniref:tigger transposable element-derived protein 4-like n=1 Tax=Anopheles maculipalpis TaxID=1496333 RepID=UPI002158B80C|nr:tigger transposable element-derived protein 4-like [Anopheles maculipalpis]
MSLRKHKCFSQRDKLKIIEAYEAGKSRSEIIHEFGLPLSSYYKIISNRDSTRQQCLQGKGYVRRNRSSDYPNLERCVLHWINQRFGAEGQPLEGPVIKAQAKLFSIKLGIDDFSASNGWLDGFKKRHDITLNRSQYALASGVGRHGTDCFTNLLDEYEANDIYSIAVTGLFYKCLPEQICKYQSKERLDSGIEQENLTVLLCANITGTEKLPILVIGRTKWPELLEDKQNPSVRYEINAKAWITAPIFLEWLTELNDKMVANERQIVLLVNQLPVPVILPRLANVKIVTHPSKFTSDDTQPRHDDLIHSFKQNYRSDMVTYLLNCRKKRIKPSIKLSYALDVIARAWQHVNSDTIVNHFMQAGCWPYTLCDSLSQQETKAINIRPNKSEWDKLALHEPKLSFNDYVRVDEKVAVTGMFTNDEIVEMVTNQAKSEHATDEKLGMKEHLDEKWRTIWRTSGRMTRTSSTVRISRQLYAQDTDGNSSSNSYETVIDQQDALKALETLHKFFKRHAYQDATTFNMLYDLETRIQAIEV